MLSTWPYYRTIVLLQEGRRKLVTRGGKRQGRRYPPGLHTLFASLVPSFSARAPGQSCPCPPHLAETPLSTSEEGWGGWGRWGGGGEGLQH